jgi:hypothetical protein
MKTAGKVFLLMILAQSVFVSAKSQIYVQGKGIKSIVVTEEKYDMLIKKQFKESETYYDQKGNILEEINYKDGKVDKHFKYLYDSESNKIKEEEFDAAGRMIEYSEYKYDKGLRIEKIVYDSSKKMKSKKAYTYTVF